MHIGRFRCALAILTAAPWIAGTAGTYQACDPGPVGCERGMRGMARVSPFSGAERVRAAWRCWRSGAALLCLVAASWHGSARAQQVPAPVAPIPVELNKLEPLPVPAAAPGVAAAPGPGCRAYIVATNPAPEPVTQLRLDLVLFGTDGVIARRIALDLAPLAPRKTTVRLFDLAGLSCDDIGRVLVNDVLACQSGQHEGAPPADQARQACLDRLQLSSRARAELIK